MKKITVILWLGALTFQVAANPQLQKIETSATTTVSPDNPISTEQLLQRIDDQRVYSNQLDHLKRAIEKELSIVKLMKECESLRVACTGAGLSQLPPPKPPIKTKTITQSKSQPLSIPEVIGVAQGRALVKHKGRTASVADGERVGRFLVKKVALDYLILEHAKRRFTVPVQQPLK